MPSIVPILSAGTSPATGFTLITAFAMKPDGLKAVLATDTGLWELTFAGTVLTQLTPNFASTVNTIQYSNDGTKLVLSSGIDIWTLLADGTTQVKVLAAAGTIAYLAPSWNVGGTKLLVSVLDSSLSDTGGMFYTCNANGSGLAFLAGGSEPAEDWQGCFSPDGTKIAFNKTQTAASDGFYTMNADSTNQQFTGLPPANLNGSNIFSPSCWAPDSGSFLLSLNPLGQTITCDLDGSNQVIIYAGSIQAAYYPNLDVLLQINFTDLVAQVNASPGPTTITDYAFDCATKYLTIIGTNFLAGAIVTVVNPLGQQMNFTTFISQISTQIVVDISSFYVDFGDSQWCFTVINP